LRRGVGRGFATLETCSQALRLPPDLAIRRAGGLELNYGMDVCKLDELARYLEHTYATGWNPSAAIQLALRRQQGRQDSNLQPPVLETGALAS
jgi:hypothetical protein